MRIRHALLSSAVSISLSIGMAPPAVAQGFFQKLLGLDAPSPSQLQRPISRPIPAYRFQSRPRPYHQFRSTVDDEEMIGPPDSGGPYQTICVRACDGYYFPLRHNAWRRNFSADVKACRTACGDEARLFYYSLRGGSSADMVDLAGRRYDELPNAFAYRKKLVSTCTCKPEPWSYEEAARHRQYAESEREAAASANEEASQELEKSVAAASPVNSSGEEFDAGSEPSPAGEQAVGLKAAEIQKPAPVKASAHKRRFAVSRRGYVNIRYRRSIPVRYLRPASAF